MSAVKDRVFENETGIRYSDAETYAKSLAYEDRIFFWTDVWFLRNKFSGQILDILEVWSELPSKPDNREYVVYACMAAAQ